MLDNIDRTRATIAGVFLALSIVYMMLYAVGIVDWLWPLVGMVLALAFTVRVMHKEKEQEKEVSVVDGEDLEGKTKSLSVAFINGDLTPDELLAEFVALYKRHSAGKDPDEREMADLNKAVTHLTNDRARVGNRIHDRRVRRQIARKYGQNAKSPVDEQDVTGIRRPRA
jgi:hypothetical protein